MATVATDPLAFTGRALGSRLGLSIPGVGMEVGQAAWDAVLAEFAAVDQTLSGFRDDSSVTRLNARAGAGATAIEPRLYEALSLAQRAWRITDGRFDPRVHDALRRLGQPGPIAHSATRSGLGTVSEWLTRVPRSRHVALAEPVDLHGIGKGIALRRARHAIERLLPSDAGYLLEAGGDLVGRGPGPDGDAWRIAIEDPAGGTDPIAVVAVDRGAICTSSIRIARWRDREGVERHHLIDPATGAPADAGLLAVTVASADPAWAEVRTKDLFMLGRDRIAARARTLDLAAWWVLEDGTLEMTPHARLITRWA